MSHRMEMNDLCDRIFNERVALLPLCDSDRNIMNDLRHEACETHCEDCGECLGEGAELIAIGPGGEKRRDVPYITRGDHNYCEDCA